METVSKIFGGSIAAALLSLSLITGVQGQPTGRVPGSFGGELRGITQFTGHVVCAGCDLEEVRQSQPDLTDLYQLNHDNGQVVMQVESFSDSSEHRRWESIVGLSHHVRARASDHVFEELSAEENRFKKMAVTGLLRSTRTLDIESVKVEG